MFVVQQEQEDKDSVEDGCLVILRNFLDIGKLNSISLFDALEHRAHLFAVLLVVGNILICHDLRKRSVGSDVALQSEEQLCNDFKTVFSVERERELLERRSQRAHVREHEIQRVLCD